MTQDSWSMQALRAALNQYQADLQAAGMAENTIQTYVDRADRFVRYLAGDYRPGN